MLSESQLAAVVTVPFAAKKCSGMYKALPAILDLPIGWAIIVYDVKMARLEAAQKVFEDYRPRFAADDRRLSMLGVDSRDQTTARWRAGICEALHDPQIQAVFLFAGDLADDPTPENRHGWQQMVQAAGPKTLVLGDYESQDRFKSQFDTLVTFPVIECLYPGLAAAAKRLRQTKMRTEFQLIGRTVFEHFGTTHFTFGSDPTVELILGTLGNVGLRVERVWLNLITDYKGRRHPMGQAEQIFRFITAPMIARIRDAASRESKLQAYDEVTKALERLFGVVLNALEGNRRAMLTEMEQEMAPQSGPGPK